jgi:RNA polymerase sigma-70 factor (ECF subfamily)
MEVIDAMPKLRRQVFIMARVEGHSHVEISQSLGVSRKAIEKHMSRALADLVKARRKWRGESERTGEVHALG